MLDRIYMTNFRRIVECNILLRDGMTVIIGNNGTGKSTIIEGVMFALYGKSKTGTKKDSVRRIGAGKNDRTSVSVDFTISKLHYRCVRYYTPKMSLMATLCSYDDASYAKLLGASKSGDNDKSLGDEIARGANGVTEAVRDLLGTSYDGFKASFVAQQKELDSLASMTQENKRKFFLDLLGYSKLDAMKPQLSSDVRSARKTIAMLSKQDFNIKAIDADIKRIEASISERDKRIESGRKYTEKAKIEADKASRALSERNAIRAQASSIMEESESLEEELRLLQSHISSLKKQNVEDEEKTRDYDSSTSVASQISVASEKARNARSYDDSKQNIIALRASESDSKATIKKISTDIAELQKKTAKEPDIDTPQKKLMSLREKRSALEQQENTTRKSIESTANALEEAIDELEEAETRKRKLREKTEELNDAISALQKRTVEEPDIDTPQKKLMSLREKRSALEQQENTTRKSIESMSNMLKKVESGGDVKCPTCGSTISSDEGADHLKKEIASSEELARDVSDKKTSINESISACEQELESAQASMSMFRSDSKKLLNASKELEACAAKIEDTESDLKNAQRKAESILGSAISNGKYDKSELLSEYRQNEENSIKAIEGEKQKVNDEIEQCESDLETAQMLTRTYNMNMTNLAKNRKELELVNKELSATSSKINEEQEKLEALSPYKLSRSELRKLDERIIKMKEQLKVENEMREASERLMVNRRTLEEKTARLSSVESELAKKRKYLADNESIIQSADDDENEAKKASIRRDRYMERLNELEKENVRDESELASARGNKKIAIKQEEDLAESRRDEEISVAAQIVVEKLRSSLPSRIAPKLAETASHLLDIATNGRYTMVDISDDYDVSVLTDEGMMPIAQMSGGESDVVSLCIRIAISQMLLEASGSGAQAMILDEIFGALDDERRESTCMALKNIGSEITRILCITHIDEIKDMADWTYVVETDENGDSHVREQKDSLRVEAERNSAYDTETR